MAASIEGISEAYQQLIDAEALAAANPTQSRIMLISGTGPNGLIQPDAYMDAVADLPGLRTRRELVLARNDLRRERQALLVGTVPIHAIVSSATLEGAGHLAEELVEGFRNLNAKDKVTIRRIEHVRLPPILREHTTEIVSTPDGHHIYFENAGTTVNNGMLVDINEWHDPYYIGPEHERSVGFANLAALALGTAVPVHQSW